jgi:hypothetical protein
VGEAQDPTGGSMAELMAGMPEVWRRLLTEHVPDRMGRCRACRSVSGAGERWPCSLARIADDAQRILGLQLGRAVGE